MNTVIIDTAYPNRKDFVDLSGQTFGYLQVLKYAGRNVGRKTCFWCKCLKCGREIPILGESLKNGTAKSCGCLQRETASNIGKRMKPTIHGMTNTRIHNIWKGMKSRCYNKNAESYPRYGGRGIKVCDEWLPKIDGFINFYNWAMENGYQENLSIDRINNDGNYEPSNCRWATSSIQNTNRSDSVYITLEMPAPHGSSLPSQRYTIPMGIWSKITGIREGELHYRLITARDKWTVNAALTTPTNFRDRTLVLNIGPYMQYNRPDKFDISIHD